MLAKTRQSRKRPPRNPSAALIDHSIMRPEKRKEGAHDSTAPIPRILSARARELLDSAVGRKVNPQKRKRSSCAGDPRYDPVCKDVSQSLFGEGLKEAEKSGKRRDSRADNIHQDVGSKARAVLDTPTRPFLWSTRTVMYATRPLCRWTVRGCLPSEPIVSRELHNLGGTPLLRRRG